MTPAAFKAWINQPSTILGLGTFGATVSALIAHVLTHDTTVSAASGAAAFALVHVVLPDNSGAASSVEKLVTDAVTAAAQKKLAAALPGLIQDGLAVVNSIAAPVTTVTTTTTAQTVEVAPVAAPVVQPAAVAA